MTVRTTILAKDFTPDYWEGKCGEYEWDFKED
jgi:hypothetical protein